MATTTSASSLDCLATVSSEPPLVARRVLIIEPHPDDAATLQGWVEATGRFDVTVVPYLPPTDDLLLAEDWGLIVVDLHEPTIEDVELVRRARATRGWTPVLLIVARDRDDQLSRALRASVDDVLVGQVTAVEIVGAVVHLVQDPGMVTQRRALACRLTACQDTAAQSFELGDLGRIEQRADDEPPEPGRDGDSVDEVTIRDERLRPGLGVRLEARRRHLQESVEQGAALEAGERRDHAVAEPAADLEHRTLVEQRVDDLADVVDAQPVLGHDVAQQPLVRRGPHSRPDRPRRDRRAHSCYLAE